MLLDDRGDLAVQLLPARSEERFVGGVLHQGVLENVDRIGWRALLERQPGCDELSGLECGATAAISSQLNSRPIAAPICAISLTGVKRSSRAISESRKVSGIASVPSLPGIFPAIAGIPNFRGLEDRLRQLLHEQRHAVGL